MKTILVFYIDTRGFSPQQVNEYIDSLSERMREIHDQEQILAYYIPTIHETKIECLRANRNTKRVLDDIQREVIEWSNSLPRKSQPTKRQLNQPDV